MLLRTLLIFGLLGSAAAMAAEPSADEVFGLLTSHAWKLETGSSRYQRRVDVVLLRDGTYQWTAHSDAQERNDSGKWSFELVGASAGVMHLSESGDMPFRLAKDQLVLDRMPLERGAKHAYGEAERMRTVKDLQPVERTKEGQRLTKQAWVKSHPFDDYGAPQRIEFTADQRYRATYRDGACEHGGNWSLVKDDANRYDFDSHADDNPCDLRGGPGGLTHYYLRFVDDLLWLGSGYVPADKKPEKSIFLFDRYGNSVLTRGEFVGDFVAGKPLVIDFTHTSEDGSEYELKSFAVGMQKYTLVKGGYIAGGDAHWLVERDLKSIKVTSGKPHSHRIEFKPPAAGEMGFLIRFKYSNQWQTYDGYQSYLVTVR